LPALCTVSAPQPERSGGLTLQARPGGTRQGADNHEVAVGKPVSFSMNVVEIKEKSRLVLRASKRLSTRGAGR